MLAGVPNRYVFLAGLVPALIVAVDSPRGARKPPTGMRPKQRRAAREPRVSDLFRGQVLRTTLLTMAVCALSLTAHWAFMFWSAQHLRQLPEVAKWTARRQDRAGQHASSRC